MQNKIKRHIGKIEQLEIDLWQIESIAKKDIGNMASRWKGSASKSFIQRYEKTQREMKKMYSEINKIKNNLNKLAQEIERADDERRRIEAERIRKEAERMRQKEMQRKAT